MRKKIFLLFLFLLIAAKAAIAGVFGVEPSYLGIGARSLGLGQVTAATFKRSEAMFINPAGLAEARSLNFNYMYGKYFDKDVAYSVFSIVYPTPYLNIGFGYGDIKVGGIYQTAAPAAPGLMPQIDSTLSYSNRVFILSLAREYKSLDYGMSFKIFRQNLTGGTVSGGSANGYDIDIGLAYQLNRIKMYLSCQNLLATKLTLGSGAKEDIPSQTRLGLSTEFFQGKLLIAGDINIDGKVGRPITLHTGFEYQPFEFMALRAGIEQEPVSNDRYHNFTFGLGLNYGGFNFDYAWKQCNNLSQNNTNFFTIGYSLSEKYFYKKESIIKAVASPPLVIIAKKEKTEFADIKNVHEKKEIGAISGFEIAQGKSDGLFHPHVPLQKVEAAKMIFKCLKLKGKNQGTNIHYVIKGRKDTYKVVMEIKKKGKNKVIRRYKVTGIKPFKRYSFSWQGEDIHGREVTAGLYEYEIRTYDNKKAVDDFKGEIAVKAEKMQSTAKTPAKFKKFFKDVPVTHWAAGIIYKLSKDGILREDNPKTYNPYRSVTHKEFLVALVRAIEKNKVKFYSDRIVKKEVLSSFKGVNGLSTKQKKCLQLFYQGLEKTYPGLDMNSSVSRAQAAKIIYNFLELL